MPGPTIYRIPLEKTAVNYHPSRKGICIRHPLPERAAQGADARAARVVLPQPLAPAQLQARKRLLRLSRAGTRNRLLRRPVRGALECGSLLPLSLEPACWRPLDSNPAFRRATGTVSKSREQARGEESGSKLPHSKAPRARMGSKAAAPIKPGWDTKPASAPVGSRSFRVRQLAAAFYQASLLAASRLKSRLPEGNGQSVEIPRTTSRGGKRQQAAAVQSSANANGLGGGPGVGITAGGIRVKISVAYGNQLAGVGGVEVVFG